MQKKQQFSNLIYEYFFLRIKFEYYECGDTLPSIETLCREFSVSSQTVQSALKRLRSEGYISMHNGRPTSIIYRQTEEELSEFVLEFYSKRYIAFSDLNDSGSLIYLPLMVEGLRRMEKDDISYISDLSEQAATDDLLYFYCFVLQKLQNPLIMNLFWEIAMFQGFLLAQRNTGMSLYDTQTVRNYFKEVAVYTENQNWDKIYEVLLTFQKTAFEEVRDYIQKNIPPAPKTEQIPFEWRIYREHPQRCYSLAVHLLHEMCIGEYKESEYLPSYEKMSKKYHASVSTMRRTINLLNQLGAAQPINGKGTRICRIREDDWEPDLTITPIRRNLAFFFQAFEIIIYSCESAIHITLSAMTPEDKQELMEQLKKDLEDGRCELSLWHLLFMTATRSPLQGIREIYAKIYGLFLWGYSLKPSRKTEPDNRRRYRLFTESLLPSLEENDIDQCTAVVKNFVSEQFVFAENYLISHGFQQDELRLSSAIRLLLPAIND